MGEFLEAPQRANAAKLMHKIRRMGLSYHGFCGLNYNRFMQIRTHLLFPFDLGLELDFSGQAEPLLLYRLQNLDQFRQKPGAAGLARRALPHSL